MNDIQIIGRKKQLVGKLWNRQEKKRLLAPHGTTPSLLREEQSKSRLVCISMRNRVTGGTASSQGEEEYHRLIPIMDTDSVVSGPE